VGVIGVQWELWWQEDVGIGHQCQWLWCWHLKIKVINYTEFLFMFWSCRLSSVFAVVKLLAGFSSIMDVIIVCVVVIIHVISIINVVGEVVLLAGSWFGVGRPVG